MEKAISFNDVFNVIKKRLWVIVLAVILCVAFTVFYGAFLTTKQYSAKATVLIASGVLFKEDNGELGEENKSEFDKTEYITAGELSTTLALMKSFAGILSQSKEYYESALEVANAKGLNKEYTYSQLRSMTSVEFDEDSIFVTVIVNTTDKQDAEVLIDALAEVAPESITDKLARTSAVVLNVDERASENSVNWAVVISIAILVGLVGSIMVLMIIDKYDNTIKDEAEFEKLYDVPVLGVVPEFEVALKRERKGGR